MEKFWKEKQVALRNIRAMNSKPTKKEKEEIDRLK